METKYMPYIISDRRQFLNKSDGVNRVLDNMANIHELTKGDLTYLVYQFAVQYLYLKGNNYQNISDTKAALRDAADEIHDLFMRPRENEAIKKNGNVLPKGFVNP